MSSMITATGTDTLIIRIIDGGVPVCVWGRGMECVCVVWIGGVCVCACVHVCVYVCVYVFVYTAQNL